MSETLKQRDKTEKFHNALIQHGPLSNRIYLMKLNRADPKQLIGAMEELAKKNAYTKIFAKVPAHQAQVFLDSGYQQEAAVPDFFHGREAAIFLGRYLNQERQKEVFLPDIENILGLALKKEKQDVSCSLPANAILRQCLPDDARKISRLYREVFPSYPFPIDNPAYITDTMFDNVAYFCIEIDKKLVSLSSAEMDSILKNVEMTDFATLPEFRGNSYAGLLLKHMEYDMRSRGIQTAYTIARAVSPGMNITFCKAGYTYGGRLINNTNISGQIESMNIWYKKLLV